ncbi:hypothetical protein ALC53_00510 [Atta colombica]|uniref:Uncharacterized protein n=1 Tax=Atta colombica TaxID=520822 RepID=A0A195BYF8_9HYME|nr:hypothetical protein ALC53_00510 [Atta colombica]
MSGSLSRCRTQITATINGGRLSCNPSNEEANKAEGKGDLRGRPHESKFFTWSAIEVDFQVLWDRTRRKDIDLVTETRSRFRRGIIFLRYLYHDDVPTRWDRSAAVLSSTLRVARFLQFVIRTVVGDGDGDGDGGAAGGKFHITQSPSYGQVQRGARAVNHTEMKSSAREIPTLTVQLLQIFFPS